MLLINTKAIKIQGLSHIFYALQYRTAKKTENSVTADTGKQSQSQSQSASYDNYAYVVNLFI